MTVVAAVAVAVADADIPTSDPDEKETVAMDEDDVFDDAADAVMVICAALT